MREEEYSKIEDKNVWFSDGTIFSCQNSHLTNLAKLACRHFSDARVGAAVGGTQGRKRKSPALLSSLATLASGGRGEKENLPRLIKVVKGIIQREKTKTWSGFVLVFLPKQK